MLDSFPRVSIITATYNADAFLADCIESIIDQTYPCIELIIIDGGSTDATLNIIEHYRKYINFFISEPDRGIYDAWNKGLAAATGDWIAFVGADDILLPNAIAIYIDHIRQHSDKNIEFISSKIQLVKTDLTVIDEVGVPWVWETFKIRMATYHLGCFHSRSLFETYGNFDINYKISGDYELLLRAKEKLRTSYIDQVTAQMRVGGVSNKFLYKAIEETYQAKVKNGLLSLTRGRIMILIDKIRTKLKI